MKCDICYGKGGFGVVVTCDCTHLCDWHHGTFGAHELTALRKLASERLDRVKELEAECEALGAERAVQLDRTRIIEMLNADLLRAHNALKAELAEARLHTQLNDARAELRGLHKVCADQHAELANWRDINRVWEGEEALAKLKAECQALRSERDAVVAYRLVQVEQDSRVLSSVEASLTTAREETRRAERDWTKALAERDEARAQRDAAQTELTTARAEQSVVIDKHTETEIILRHELATADSLLVRGSREFQALRLSMQHVLAELAELTTARAERDAAREGFAQYYKERNSLLESHLPTLKRKGELLAELATTRAALSKLEQAARGVTELWGCNRTTLRPSIRALERALNEVSK